MKEFKKLKIFTSKIEAEIAKSYLESKGIKSYILADDAGNMVPSQDFVSGVILLVGKNDYKNAKEILTLLNNSSSEH